MEVEAALACLLAKALCSLASRWVGPWRVECISHANIHSAVPPSFEVVGAGRYKCTACELCGREAVHTRIVNYRDFSGFTCVLHNVVESRVRPSHVYRSIFWQPLWESLVRCHMYAQQTAWLGSHSSLRRRS